MIQIKILWAVLLIVVIHTILSHLLNWGIRKACSDDETLLMAIATLVETILLIVALSLLL